MIKQVIIYTVLLNVCLVFTHAQESVSGLQSNYAITIRGDKHEKSHAKSSTGLSDLPFLDDFSGNSVFPETSKWIDNSVFINNTFSDLQITTGVATFDALNNSGRMYETASSSVFKADELTSQPINLSYISSDNIWLSFYFQAGGLGDSPEANDSLSLQFFAPDENKWYSVWQVEGNTDQKFKPVIIRIDNPRYLKSGFQFRFVNYVSLSSNPNDPSMIGNCDIWNIDYVLLDKNRNAGDTVFADVAFRLPLRSLLKNHEAMPWQHFKQINLQEMGFSIPIHYRNNDDIVRNVTRNFQIWDVYKNTESESFSAGATNIDPSANIDYSANLVYNFYNPVTENYDSALFKITCTLKTDAFDPKGNDTLIYYQVFKNYFAFDDGSAEGGYGINGLGSRNAMAAYKFVSYIPDTLRAINICFNDSYLNSNIRAFDLMVWDNNNGMPGNVIYTQEEVMVEQGDNINGFSTYNIPEGIMVSGIFYVGWKQRTETFLNAGLDINTVNTGRQFYWLNGEWRQSQVKGSIMIRPIVGAPVKVTAINDALYLNKKLSIWPNPVSDYINISCGELQIPDLAYISVMDISGRELMKIPFHERIDVSSLHEGLYIIILKMNGRVLGYNRIIKTR